MHSLDELLTAASETSALLASTHRQLSDVRAAELTAKRQSWLNSPETTITGRQRDMDFNSLDLSIDVLQLEGEIRALTVHLADIDRRLTYTKGS